METVSATFPQFPLPTVLPIRDIGVARVPIGATQSPSPEDYSRNSQISAAEIEAEIFSNSHSRRLRYNESLMSQGGLMQSNFGRSSIYSPTGPAYPRSSQSPAEGLPPPTFDSSSPAFPLPLPGGGVGHSSLLSQSSNQHTLQNPIMNNSHNQGSHSSTPATTAGPDNYAHQSSSRYYPAPTPPTSLQSSFPPFTAHASPPQPSPTTTGALPRSISALSPQHQSPMQPPHFQGHHQYPYSGGPVLSNVTNPRGQMHLVNAMHMPNHHYHPQSQMLSHPLYHGQSPQQQDRPYKCDECPTQFNRNHDLKRHKRIHLAIKPFPCTYCDKSFSRKDALKRHRLVKGCGNGKDSPGDINDKPPRDEPNFGIDGPSNSSGMIKDEPI